jgi:hypothetical protein
MHVFLKLDHRSWPVAKLVHEHLVFSVCEHDAVSQRVFVLGFLRLRERVPIPFLNRGEGIAALTSVDGVPFWVWWILPAGGGVRIERLADVVALLGKNRGRRGQKQYGERYSDSRQVRRWGVTGLPPRMQKVWDSNT